MTRSIVFAIAGMSLVLGGCATMNGQRSSQYGPDVDVEKVMTVNQWAQTRGAVVMWINYPQKSRIADTSTVN